MSWAVSSCCHNAFGDSIHLIYIDVVEQVREFSSAAERRSWRRGNGRAPCLWSKELIAKRCDIVGREVDSSQGDN